MINYETIVVQQVVTTALPIFSSRCCNDHLLKPEKRLGQLIEIPDLCIVLNRTDIKNELEYPFILILTEHRPSLVFSYNRTWIDGKNTDRCLLKKKKLHIFNVFLFFSWFFVLFVWNRVHTRQVTIYNKQKKLSCQRAIRIVSLLFYEYEVNLLFTIFKDGIKWKMLRKNMFCVIDGSRYEEQHERLSGDWKRYNFCRFCNSLKGVNTKCMPST